MNDRSARAPRLRWLYRICVVLLTACGPADTASEVQIFAASSLTDAFRELGVGFEEAYGIRPRLTFAGSQVLRVQIEQGAPADVFASADPDHMASLVAAGLASSPAPFAGNRLALIVPVENPDKLRALSDLDRAERLVLGSPTVPIGRYSREFLAAADARMGAGFSDRVLERVVSEETNVRLIRAKVQLGEASAALVYESDAVGASDILAIPLASDLGVKAEYQASRIIASANPTGADLWLAWIRSEAGSAVLRRHGFLVP